MELYVVRHIRPAIAEGICYGHLDVPIPADHAIAHRAIAAQLPVQTPVFSSPLSRCSLLAATIDPEFTTDERLKELHFGRWEGQAWDQIDRTELDPWGNDYIHLAPPEGESLQTLLDRFREFSDELLQSGLPSAIVVTHSGIIRCAMHLYRGVALDQIMAEKVGFGEVFHFHISTSATEIS